MMLTELLELIADTAEKNCSLGTEISLEELPADGGIYAELGEGFTESVSYNKQEVKMIPVLFLCRHADQKGWGSSEVTGAQLTLTLTGSVKPGDDACDYILSDDVMYGLGEKRKTHMKIQKGKKVIIWPITLANITPAYGDANNINSLTVTIHGNGRPSIGTTA